MFLKRIFHETTLQAVSGAILTAAVAVAAVVTKAWTWPNAVVGGVLLWCGLLYLLDRFDFAAPSQRTRVRNWLDESGFGIQSHNDANTIHFVMVDNIGFYTHIVQTKHGDPLLIYMPSLRPTEKQLAVFNAMGEEEKDEFWKPIRHELLRSRSQYTNLRLDGDGVTISSQLALSKTLTGVEFLREVLNVRSLGRLYLQLVAEALPEEKSTAAQAD